MSSALGWGARGGQEVRQTFSANSAEISVNSAEKDASPMCWPPLVLSFLDREGAHFFATKAIHIPVPPRYNAL